MRPRPQEPLQIAANFALTPRNNPREVLMRQPTTVPNTERARLARQFRANSRNIARRLARRNLAANVNEISRRLSQVHISHPVNPVTRSNLIRGRAQLKHVAPSTTQLSKKAVNILRTQLKRNIHINKEAQKHWNNSKKLYNQGQYLNALKKLRNAEQVIKSKKGARIIQDIFATRANKLQNEYAKFVETKPRNYYHPGTHVKNLVSIQKAAQRHAVNIDPKTITGQSTLYFGRIMSMIDPKTKLYNQISNIIKSEYNKLDSQDPLKRNIEFSKNRNVLKRIHKDLKNRYNTLALFHQVKNSNKFRDKVLVLSKLKEHNIPAVAAVRNYFNTFVPSQNILNKIPKPPRNAPFTTKKLWLMKVFTYQHQHNNA